MGGSLTERVLVRPEEGRTERGGRFQLNGSMCVPNGTLFSIYSGALLFYHGPQYRQYGAVWDNLTVTHATVQQQLIGTACVINPV